MADVYPATEADVLAIGSNLRQEDKDEAKAATGLCPEVAAWFSFYKSPTGGCWVIKNKEEDEIPIGMFGVCDHSEYDYVGVPWMIATPELESIQYRFIRRCREWVNKLHYGYWILTNVVDERNTTHIKWLKWCGFRFIKRHERYGPYGLPFLEFVRGI